VIILDTNVLSELTRARPAAAVLAWLDELPASEVATTAITAAELRYRVARLSDGARKSALAAAVEAILGEDLAGRVHPFDTQAEVHYAELVTHRERSGRPINLPDEQIAAICRAHQSVLATRNINDFTDTGIDLFNPWTT
jgi:hypothetical protein